MKPMKPMFVIIVIILAFLGLAWFLERALAD